MNKSAPTAMVDAASPALEKRIEESIAKAVPVILAKFFSSGSFNALQEPSSKNVDSSSPSNATDEEAPGPSSRGERVFPREEDSELSSELLDLTTQAFTKPLTKEEAWNGSICQPVTLQSRGRNHLCVLPPWRLA